MAHAEAHPAGSRFLHNLAHLVPGYHGYRERERRRDEDSRLRARVLERLSIIRRTLAGLLEGLAEAGRHSWLDSLDGRAQRLDNVADAIRYAPYGFSGFFDVAFIREDSLERILEADLMLFEDLDALEQILEPDGIPSGTGAPRREFLDRLDGIIELFERHLIMRDKILGDA